MAHSSYPVRDNAELSRFEADLGDGTLAIAEYRLDEGRIAFTHTEVPSAYEGRGIGTALVQFALGWARERGLRVAPICPFFAAYIQDHQQQLDLLDPLWRANLDID